MFIPRAAGHFMMRENGWEPVPAKVSRKFTRWNFDAYLNRLAGAMVGHAYKHDSVRIDEFAIEYELNQFGLKMIFTAKEVKKESVDSKLFEIPQGYKETTQEELMKMFEGKQ
jgi:hypothetical protein